MGGEAVVLGVVVGLAGGGTTKVGGRREKRGIMDFRGEQMREEGFSW